MKRSMCRAGLPRAAARAVAAIVAHGFIPGAVLSGCAFSAGSVARDNIEVQVSDPQGIVAGPMCTELPVLWGAQVERELPVADALVVRVVATSRVVELSITGDDVPSAELHDISLDELRSDQIADIQIATPAGDYTVTIQAGCSG
jgi:hypothetical protein